MQYLEAEQERNKGYIIHYGTANSGRFKKGSTGNTPKSKEALNKKRHSKRLLEKNGNKKISEISDKEYSKFKKIADDVIRGNYGNGEIRKQKMKKAGYDYDTVQNIVNNKLIGTKLNFSVKGMNKKKPRNLNKKEL